MSAPTVDGFVHEVGVYASDEEFADYVVPFADEGRDGGDAVVFAYDERKTILLKQWLAPSPAFTYLTDSRPYDSPAKALRFWRQVVLEHLGRGARGVRIAGNVPHPGYGVPYQGWDRYEAAIEHALGDLPVWAPCLYDARITPPEVLERAHSLHRSVRGPDGSRHRNGDFHEPTALGDFLVAIPDPLERTAPAFEFDDPAPGTVRGVIRTLAAQRLTEEETEVLVLAASEAVTNAILHGAPPARVRGWVGEDRVVVEIHDSGPGPDDPLAGLLQRTDPDAESGRGLWIAHQLDLDIALTVDADGFTVRLRTGTDPG